MVGQRRLKGGRGDVNVLYKIYNHDHFYRTRVRSLAMLVTNSLTDCRLGNLIDVATVIDVDDEK